MHACAPAPATPPPPRGRGVPIARRRRVWTTPPVLLISPLGVVVEGEGVARGREAIGIGAMERWK